MPFKAILNQQPRCSKEELNRRQKLKRKVSKAELSPPHPGRDPHGRGRIQEAQRALQELYVQVRSLPGLAHGPPSREDTALWCFPRALRLHLLLPELGQTFWVAPFGSISVPPKQRFSNRQCSRASAAHLWWVYAEANGKPASVPALRWCRAGSRTPAQQEPKPPAIQP